MKQVKQVGLSGVALAALALPSQAAEQPSVRVLQAATTETAAGFYMPNRAPLQPTAFLKLPIGSITPQGWLRHQLELDATGLSGGLPQISDYIRYEGNGWVDPKSNSGWEELPYWLRGYGDLGYVLKDDKIIAEAKKWIAGILANQKPDGYFGPDKIRPAADGGGDPWPHMLVLDAVRSYYEYAGDPRVVTFMANYFKWVNTQPPKFFSSGWGAVRWADNLANVHWLYNQTGEAWLLDLAQKIHANSADYTTKIPTWHNVNLAQGIREPAQYWLQAKDPKLLDATVQDYAKIMALYGQFPGGGFAGDENARPGFGDPRQGFETCGIVEFMHTFEMMTRITGDPVWADRCEELAFNSLPAALTPDHKGVHYITCANLVQIDNQKKGNQFQNKFAMLAFKPGLHDYRCCPHNYPMGWPYYAEELWLATADKGLCASLYAASQVKAQVGDGTQVQCSEATDYPFSDTIQLRLSTPKTVRFPLYLRVPRWCAAPAVKINGQPVAVPAGPLSYIVLERAWQEGDAVTLQLPMQVAVRTWEKNKNAVSVDYGPLTFSLAIAEKWSRFAGSDAWPEWEVFAQSAWNYGLEFDAQNPASAFEVVHQAAPLPAQPFVPDAAPVQLRAKARKIPGWQADANNVVGVLQQSPARTAEPVETVTLIPMGAARLRIASFPTVGTGPDAHDWTPPARPALRPSASHVFGGDTLEALADGIEPANSADATIPRLTWWNHQGTPEWVQYDFDQPRRVSAVAVYWFDDTGHGQCRVPQSWRLLSKDGDAWKPVAATGAYGTARDTYNRVAFTPVTTSALRLETQLQAGVSGGILEWKIEPAP